MKPVAFVTVVSGLPRSGTSLVMQMLQAGGMPVLADERRSADADNPRGYFEYEPVRRIATDASFVVPARGHAIKIVVPLLRHLPVSNEYRVLLVTRRLDEVIASQDAMLARRGANDPDALAPQRLAEIYEAQLTEARTWIANTPGCRALELPHADLLRDPLTAAATIDTFLAIDLDRASMARAIDPSLYRQRSSN